MRTLLCFLFLLPVIAFAQTYESASAYMESLNSKYEQIKTDTWAYTRAVAHNKAGRKIEKRRYELLSTISAAKNKIAKMDGYNGDISYRDSVVHFLDMNYDILNNDYAKIVDMEEIAEQSYDLMEAYIKAQEVADEKLKIAGTNLIKGQTIFANNNNILLRDSQDETSKKLEEAGMVYDYYNEIYLIFFKCYKQEAYLLDAYSRADISAMEQNKNQLQIFAEEGLEKLNSMNAFRGDNDLLTMCKQLLNFYVSESKEYSPQQIDFYIKKETFENVKKAFDAKANEKKTQKDVDRYNASLQAYNDGINTFNSINTKLNQQRVDLFNSWNSVAKSFTGKHIQKR